MVRVTLVVVASIWFLLGTALYVFYKTHPELLVPTLKTGPTFPLFIARPLPPGVTGLVIAGLFRRLDVHTRQQSYQDLDLHVHRLLPPFPPRGRGSASPGAGPPANARKNVWLKKVPDGMIEISGHRPIERA